MLNITISAPHDLEAVHRIRHEVFVVEQHVAPEEEWDGLDDTCVHLVAHSAGEAIGTIRIFPEYTPVGAAAALDGDGIDDISARYLYKPAEYKAVKLQRLAVLEGYRGSGAGRALVEAAEEWAVAHGYSMAYLGAQVNALSFYRKLGYRSFGAEFDDAGIAHRMMVKALSADKA